MKLTEAEILRRFHESLPEPSENPFLLAWSGGLDSTVLLYLLLNHSPLSVEAAYYNHSLRSQEEMDRELRFIEQTAEKWMVPLHMGAAQRGEIERLKEEHGGSLEEWARNLRYAFLEQRVKSIQGEGIFTAHHQNDQVETLLIRFLQGSSLMGLCGLNQNQGWEVARYRPLLSFSREELHQIAEYYGLSWSADSTNMELDYLRNRVRHELIPHIKELFPHFENSLSSGAKKNLLYKEVIQTMESIWSHDNGIWSVSLNSWNSLPGAQRLENLYALSDRLLKDEKRGFRIPYRFFKPLVENPIEKRILISGHGITVRTRKGYLELFPAREEVTVIEDVIVRLDRIYHFPYFNLILSKNRLNDHSFPLPVDVEPFMIRGRRNGDLFKRPGRLKKKLSSWPSEKRSNIRLLTRGNEVIALLDHKADQVERELLSMDIDPGQETIYITIERKSQVSP